MMTPRTLFALAFAALTAPSGAQFQCPDADWLPGDGYPGTDYGVNASVLWDPDGDGPQEQRLVIGGYFTTAGNKLANRIASYDPATGEWDSLGAGMNDEIIALGVLPNGNLVAGGEFTSAGGNNINYLAQWDGTDWLAVGPTLDGPVSSLTIMPNGDLVVCGAFDFADKLLVHKIARWNGSNWSRLGDGHPGRRSPALVAALSNGDLIGSGDGFIDANGSSISSRLSRWDGKEWSPVGGNVISGGIYCVKELPNGDIIAGGTISSVNDVPAPKVARWDGEEWHPLGDDALPVNSAYDVVWSLEVMPNGSIVAGGRFVTSGHFFENHIALWDGSTWTSLGDGLSYSANTIQQLPDGRLFAGGNFMYSGHKSMRSVALWDGNTWNAMSPGFDDSISTFLQHSNGDLFAAGSFTHAGHIDANRIARWDGQRWSPLGPGLGEPGLDGHNDYVSDLIELPNGNIVAGGRFSVAGSTTVDDVAMWDGQSWQPMGTGAVGTYNYVLLPGDELAGSFGGSVYKWDGVNWNQIGSRLDSSVTELYVTKSGDLHAAGRFGIFRWTGSEWKSELVLDSTNHYIYSVTELPDGGLLVGGIFSSINGIVANNFALLDGTNVYDLGGGNGDITPTQIVSVLPLDSNEFIAGGSFEDSSGTVTTDLAHWNGSGWSPFGASNRPVSGASEFVLEQADLLLVAGSVRTTGDHASWFFSRYGCIDNCTADVNQDGAITPTDFTAWINAFNNNLPECDQNGDGMCTPTDFTAWIANFNAGC